MSTISDYLASTAEVALNAQRFDAFINGDENTEITIDGGEKIASLRRLRTLAGGLPIATQAEAEAGSVNNKTMTPLRTLQAIDKLRPYATQAEAEAANALTRILSPGRAKQLIDARLATQAEAEAGTNTDKLMTPLRVAQAIAKLATSGAANLPVLTPEKYGAKGDGATDDTAAWRALSAAIQSAGGGVVECRAGAVYIYGSQSEFQNGVGQGVSPITVTGLSRSVIIRGNGAVIRTKPGLKYGAFDPATGNPMPGITSNDGSKIATPFHGILNAQNCSAPMAVYDLEGDGNIANLVKGGQYGDTGYQMPHCGIYELYNTGQLTLGNCHFHHFGLDGVLSLRGTTTRGNNWGGVLAMNVRCEYNGRQGWSGVSGRRMTFINCQFNHTGRNGVIASNPCAGFDIEAEGGKLISQWAFYGCEFIDNVGAAVVSDTGISEDISFNNCTFVGTTGPAIFSRDPRWRFVDCLIAGVINRCYPGDDPYNATRFVRCNVTNRATYSPTGAVYMPDYCINLGIGVTATLFEELDVDLVGPDARGPYTLGGERYRNARIKQEGGQPMVPSGHYTGQCIISGPLNDAGVQIDEGKTVVNGTARYPTAQGGTSATTPWTTYTPQVIAGGGSVSLASSDCIYRIVNGVCEGSIDVTLNDSAGTQFVRFSLPENPQRQEVAHGINDTWGKALFGVINKPDAKMYVRTFDGSYPTRNGDRIMLQFRFRV